MIRREILPNGLRLVTESMPDVRSACIGVWLRRGSRHEPGDLSGISHFIEHLVFKGTETRTARDIALAVDSVGGQMDAFTSKEYTCFYAKVLDEHLPVAVDLLADIVRHPRFDPEELERERQVIVEEIRMVEDTPEELIYDLFSARFYGGHPLGRPIQGTARTVSAIARPRLLRFFRNAYRPGNILIAAAGNLRHRQVSRVVRESFGSMDRGMRGRSGTSPRPRPQGGIARREKRGLEQVHLLLGLPTFPERHEARYRLFVLNALLGGTMSSRLFQKVREERGLAYTVYSAVNSFLDTGQLVVYAATGPDRARETLDVILAELASLREEGPSRAELHVAKEHLKGSLMLSLESTVSRMSNLARQEIYFGRHFPLEEILHRIDAVRVRGVHEMCRTLFGDARLGLAAVGRTRGLRLRAEALRP
jgi:predicted Zn-dependent peptidase